MGSTILEGVAGVCLLLAGLGSAPNIGTSGPSLVANAPLLLQGVTQQEQQQLGLVALEKGKKGKASAMPVRTTLRDRPLRKVLFPFLRR